MAAQYLLRPQRGSGDELLGYSPPIRPLDRNRNKYKRKQEIIQTSLETGDNPLMGFQCSMLRSE